MLKYVIITNNNPYSGVLKKVRYQVDTLNELGIPSGPEYYNTSGQERTRYRQYTFFLL